MKTTASPKPQTSSQAVPKRGFLGTALRMKQEADAAIKQGNVAHLQEKGYKLLTFDV